MKRYIPRRVVLLTTFVLIAAISTLPVVAGGDDRLANIPKSECRARHQKLLEQIRDGIVVMVGAREDDLGEVGRFRQHNDFMYLTGVQTPAAYLILVPASVIVGSPQQETVFIPSRDIKHEQWTGVQIGPGKEAQGMFGLEEVAPSDRFKDRLNQSLTP